MHAVDSVRKDDTCCVFDEIAEESLWWLTDICYITMSQIQLKWFASQQVSL
jgi:hypothetical protein